MEKRKGSATFYCNDKDRLTTIEFKTKICVLYLADEAEDMVTVGFAYTKLLGNGSLPLSHTQSYEQERGPISPSFPSIAYSC